MLVGRNLSKRFGPTVALDEVDISVHPGRVSVLIGPSGSGKTTLVRALALLDPPDRGEIGIEGRTYCFPAPNHTRLAPPWPMVTVVFQQLFLWPHLTLRDNILLPLGRRRADSGLLDEMVNLFNMEDFIHRYPNEVSLGQRQRAALARAVILDPSYILLDEITSALDVEQTSIIMKYLLTLRDRGIGLLVVTHLIGFARRLLSRREGDQITFLDGGRVIESGDIELLVNPQNQRLRRFLSEFEAVT
jgi:ABC-type polar amino acid transport system ATPase subunit